jgi:HNH endonuclease
MPARMTLEQQLANGVDVRGADECWPWTKSCGREGHGQIGNRSTGKLIMHKAHVVAFTLATGAPPKHQVLHTCNNEPCCNPAHLYDGTPKDNAADRVAAGTQRSRPVVTFEQVCVIRSTHDGTTAHMRELADQYGLKPRALANIISGRSWRVDADGNPLRKVPR